MFPSDALLLSPSSRTRTLDPDPLTLSHANIELSRQNLMCAIGPQEGRFPRASVCPALQSPGTAFPPICQQCHFCIRQHLDFPHHSVSAAILASAATSPAQPIGANA